MGDSRAGPADSVLRSGADEVQMITNWNGNLHCLPQNWQGHLQVLAQHNNEGYLNIQLHAEAGAGWKSNLVSPISKSQTWKRKIIIIF
jgi:hypothetical protein